MTVPVHVLEGTTLDRLLSDDENRLLDTIDELRSQGVGRLLGEPGQPGLPQLIVCGDQSSGKSSVLEALTRVRFPTKSTVCTTFASELRLRRGPRSRIGCRIRAAPSRSQEEKEQLARFQGFFDSAERFPDLITAARDCMVKASKGPTVAFFEDILEVEIVGPKVVPLTIVDLPGYIHYSESKKDIDLVQSLVRSYVQQDNSIILAIISAHNDIGNQSVLTEIEKIDKAGARTLGVMTKPDELPSGSEKEAEYLLHASNNPNKFKYGWHVVRNRSYEEQDSTFEERNKREADFFQDSSWKQLSGTGVSLGIDALQQRLSRMLLDHVALSLPSLVQQLEDDLKRSEGKLARLGEARSTPKDQLNYLSDISESFREYAREALEGRYHRKSFFGDPLSLEGLEKRLRAKIRNLNDEFASRMLTQGHKWHVVEDEELDFETSSQSAITHPNFIAKSVFLERHVDTLAQVERGNELSGTSNPLLIGSLFHQQSAPWEQIASVHLDDVWNAVKDFLELLLRHLADERTGNQLLIHIIDPALENRRQQMRNKLEELLVPHRDHSPINVDPHFARRIWSTREERVAKSLVEAIRKELTLNKDKAPISSNEEIIAKIRRTESTVDDKYGSNETFEFMQAYYDSAILIFVNNVVSLAVEQCLLTGLPKIFSSLDTRDMTNEKLELIASESREIVLERDRLKERIQVLRTGIRTIREVRPDTRMNRSTPRSQMHLSNQQSVTHSPSAATDSTQISEKAGPVPTSSHDSTSETHTTAVPSATPIGKAGSQTPSTPVPAIQPPKRVAGSYPTRTSAGEAPTSQQTSRTVSEGGKSLSSSSTSNFTFRKTSPSGSSGLFGGGVSSSGFGKPSLFGISSPAPGTTATTTPSGSLGLFGGGISCSGMDKPSSGSLFGGFGTPSSASGTTAAQKPFKWSSSESSLPRPGASPNEGTKPFTQSDILEEKNSDGRSSSKVSASNPRIENS